MCTIECAICMDVRAWASDGKTAYRTVAPIRYGIACVLLFNELQHWQWRWHFDILKDSGKQHAKYCCYCRQRRWFCCCVFFVIGKCRLVNVCWFGLCECQHVRIRALGHTYMFSETKVFFCFASHPNCQCCKLRICFGEKCGCRGYATPRCWVFYLSSLFLFSFYSNLTIPNIQFISWPDIVSTNKHIHSTVEKKKKKKTFGDPLFVCLVKLFISSAPFHYNSSNSVHLCVIRLFLELLLPPPPPSSMLLLLRLHPPLLFLFTMCPIRKIPQIQMKIKCNFNDLPFSSFTFSTRASSMISNNRPERW